MGPPRDLLGQLLVEGRRRMFLTVAGEENPRAIVLLLHRSGQNGMRVREVTGRDLERLPAIVVYPDADGGEWQGLADVTFIVSLIAALKERWGSLPVILAGYSDGGRVALAALHTVPERLDGFVIVAATELADLEGVDAGRVEYPRPVTFVHGTKDRYAPYDGGPSGLRGVRTLSPGMSAPASAAYHAGRNGITTEPVTTALEGGVTRTRWSQEDREDVTLYTIAGGGHTIPNSIKKASAIYGRTCRELSIADIVQELPVS